MFYLQILWYANYVSHFASRTIYDIDSRLAPALHIGLQFNGAQSRVELLFSICCDFGTAGKFFRLSCETFNTFCQLIRRAKIPLPVWVFPFRS